MPYMLEGKCVYKKNPDGSKGASKGCSETVEMAKKHLAALYAAENKSLAEFSMTITKASIPNKADRTMRIRMVSSDTGEDVFEEKMSKELFDDFVTRIDDNSPVPEPFDVVCEDGWEGGMPYLSVSHYKSGNGANVPGMPEKVYVDGEMLKSSAILNDTPLGLAVWKSICTDIEERSKPLEERSYKNPVRVSIGFLDLEHKHEIEGEDDYVFTRTELKQTCPKCEEDVKGKVYLKGQLVHLAFTRAPANPRTSVEVYRMGEEIETKWDDAKSIIGDLAEELVGKSVVEDEALVVKSEKDYRAYANKVEEAFSKQFSPPKPSLYARSVTDKYVIVVEYTPNEDSGYGDDKVYKVGYIEKDGNFSFDKRSDWTEMEFGLMPKKSEAENVEWKFNYNDDLVEEAKQRKDVSESDKKRAEKKYGNVTYADAKNKKYPIDTEEHIRAAWNYIHQKRNAAKYSAAEVAAIKKKIIAAWKRVIGGTPPSATEKSEVTMDENLKPEEVLEDVVEEQDEIEEVPAVSEEKSHIDVATEALKAKMLELKSKGITGDEYLEAIQPLFNQVGEVVKQEGTSPMDGIADVVRSTVAESLKEAMPEIIKGVLNAMPKQEVSQTKEEIPAPRSLIVKHTANQQPNQELSQIQRLARKGILE